MSVSLLEQIDGMVKGIFDPAPEVLKFSEEPFGSVALS
jgi:hypothetical protein